MFHIVTLWFVYCDNQEFRKNGSLSIRQEKYACCCNVDRFNTTRHSSAYQWNNVYRCKNNKYLLLTAFIFYLKRNDFIDRDKQKQKTEVSTIFLMIISALIIQLLYVSLMCSVFSMELTYSNKSFPSLLECISAIIAAPLYEEVFCRMSLTDICISKETPSKK